MDILDRFYDEARRRPRTVVLPEGDDARVVAAARRLQDEGIARPILLGGPEQVEAAARTAGVVCTDLRCVAPEHDPEFDAHVRAYAERRRLPADAGQRAG